MNNDSTVVMVDYNVKVGVITDKGVRKENEDSFFVLKESNIPTFIVADGAGGYDLGKQASETCVNSFAEEIDNINKFEIEYVKKIIESKYKQLNSYLYNQYLDSGYRMMSTMTTASIIDNSIIVTNVGDTILYRIREDNVELLSQLHSLAWEEYNSGLINYEKFINHPRKNVITRAVGGRVEIVPFIEEYQIEKGDIYIICTDGVSNYISTDQLLTYFDEQSYSEDNLKAICKEVVDFVLLNKSNDNITIMIFQVQ